MYSIASWRTCRTMLCWFRRPIRFRPALKTMLVSTGQVGVRVAWWATLLPASWDTSSPSPNVSPLPCVFWLPGVGDVPSSTHVALCKQKISVKSLLMMLSVPLRPWPRIVSSGDKESLHQTSHPPPLHHFQHYRYQIDYLHQGEWWERCGCCCG